MLVVFPSRPGRVGECPIPKFSQRHPALTTRGQRKLPLANAVDEFNARQRDRRRASGLETKHRGAAPLDRPMILLNDIVEVATRTHNHCSPARILLAEQLQSPMGGGVAVRSEEHTSE